MLGHGSNSLGGEANFHAIDPLGLKVDLECAAGGIVGVTAGITSFGAASGHLTYSGHRYFRSKN